MGNSTLLAQQTPVLRVIAMPENCNAYGGIFGGWIMAQLDLAGSVLAAELAQGAVATVAVDALRFLRPVRIGDRLSCYAKLERQGRTSLSIAIQAWVRRHEQPTSHEEQVTHALITYVAVDAQGRPRTLPKQLL